MGSSFLNTAKERKRVSRILFSLMMAAAYLSYCECKFIPYHRVTSVMSLCNHQYVNKLQRMKHLEVAMNYKITQKSWERGTIKLLLQSNDLSPLQVGKEGVKVSVI